MVFPDEVPIKETNPLRPLSPYAVSKVAQDMLGYQYWMIVRRWTSCARAASTTRARAAARCSWPRDFAKQIADIEKGQQAPVLRVGNLEARRDFTDVRDMVRAYWLALEKCEPGEVYNICSGKAWTIQQMLDLLLGMTKAKIEVRQDPRACARATCPSCSATTRSSRRRPAGSRRSRSSRRCRTCSSTGARGSGRPMPGRTVLVTGVSGFVGPHLARALVASGARVVGLGVEPGPPAGVPLEAWHVADLREPAAVARAVRGGPARRRGPPRGPEQRRALVRGPRRHLRGERGRHPPPARGRARRRAGGARAGGREQRGLRPAARGLARGGGDALRAGEPLRGLEGRGRPRRRGGRPRARRGSTWSACAPSATPAPARARRFVVPAFAQQIAAVEAGRGEPVLRVGNLEVMRDLSDARDVVRAYVALLERGTRGAAYNVCRGEGVKLTEVVAPARRAARAWRSGSRWTRRACARPTSPSWSATRRASRATPAGARSSRSSARSRTCWRSGGARGVGAAAPSVAQRP